MKAMMALMGLLMLACGATEKRTQESADREACPTLDIPSEGTEHMYREYLLSLRSQRRCAETWQATLLLHIQEVSIEKDEAATGARFVELGSKVKRCSIEARQCFLPVKLKRDPLGFAYITAIVKHKRLGNAVSLDLVRSGAIGEARFMNCPPGEACELPVDLLDLLRAPRGTISVVAATRQTAEELAQQKAEEARLEEERFHACYAECFARSNALIEPKGQPHLSKLFLRWFDKTERKKCRIECTPAIGVQAPD